MNILEKFDKFAKKYYITETGLSKRMARNKKIVTFSEVKRKEKEVVGICHYEDHYELYICLLQSTAHQAQLLSFSQRHPPFLTSGHRSS